MRKPKSDGQKPSEGKPIKRTYKNVVKEDPAAPSVSAKRHKTSDKPTDYKKKSSSGAPAVSGKASKPHADAVEKSNRLWERLRNERTPVEEREALVGEVFTLFHGNLLSVLQKHDTARVLQSCFKLGTPAQRDALVGEIGGESRKLASSHYGHFLLLSILRHGTSAHKQTLLTQLIPHAAELLVHAEGSAVLQLLYSDVATAAQRHLMYRSLWGKEVALLHEHEDASGAAVPINLTQLFERDPLCKPRVLRRLEMLLAKAARKGLALTTLVQRAAAELLEHGETAARAELVSAFREQAVHMMHTRDGARIASGCLRHGDAKDRKVVLKGLKGFAPKAALDAHGALVLCTALETVDDTVFLSKGVLSELVADLPSLASHAHGALPLLQLLAPRDKRYFTPEQLAVLGGDAASAPSAASKKDPNVRRAELLRVLLPALLAHCGEHAEELAQSPRGSAVIYETIRVAGEDAGDNSADPAQDRVLDGVLGALAAAASKVAPDAVGGRLLKRLAQRHDGFAERLQQALAGKLLKCAKAGGGWVVLTMLENGRTGKAVRAELSGDAAALGKSSAAGCRSLGEVLAGKANGKAAVKANGKATGKATPTGKTTGKKAKKE